MYATFTRPYLSAKSPAPTMNSPDIKAVKLTAILIVPISLLNDVCNGTTKLTNDCANNQKVITPKIIPRRSYCLLQTPLKFCS